MTTASLRECARDGNETLEFRFCTLIIAFSRRSLTEGGFVAVQYDCVSNRILLSYLSHSIQGPKVKLGYIQGQSEERNVPRS
jgi:hypothetical protein